MSKKKTARTAKSVKRANGKPATRKKAATARVETIPPGDTAPQKPTKVNITAAKGRPMLDWVGKRPLSYVTAFPAQPVERHDALRIVGIDRHNVDLDAQDEKTRLFNDLRNQCNEECWADAPFIGTRAPEVGGLLLHGDNLDTMAYLLANGFRRSVNLIYIDPPFDSGANYIRRVQLRGTAGATEIEGEQYSVGEQIQYSDIWANDNYLQFMYERLMLMRELLHDNGSILLHCDYRKVHHLRLLMDEVFGSDGFVNEIIWLAEGGGASGVRFGRKHQTILYYTKAEKEADRTFNADAVRVPYKTENIRPQTYHFDSNLKQRPAFKNGYTWTPNEGGKVPTDAWLDCFLAEGEGIPLDVWYDVKGLYGPSGEIENYPTQKPIALLGRIIKACSKPGDLVFDCFLGSGTTVAVAQQLGRRWVGCDINKGAIQTTVKRLRGIMGEQIQNARKRAADARQGTLIETEPDDEAPPKPCAFGFTAWRVNDYDLQIQHNEAVNLACEHIGIGRTRSDSFFDGTLGKKLVKIIPFGHPLTPLDLEELRRELDARPDEDRAIVVVCLGMELAAKAQVDEWNRLRKGKDAVNRLDVIELRTDAKYGRFIKHEPATAKVKISHKARGGESVIVVEIEDFISPTIIERLKSQAGVLTPKIDDWRVMVDCIYIDTAYNGSVLNVAVADVPERKKDLVKGKYELPSPADETTVALKIIDMLGEELLYKQTLPRS